jgi:CDP-glucose 4,6-dehydratase
VGVRPGALEDVVSALPFWRGRRVFLTGHTGFKGGWLALWLHALGAEVTGFALPPEPGPGLFKAARVASRLTHIEGDIRDRAALAAAMAAARPDVVIHMAAQALVRRSYEDPVGTWSTNVMGTVNLLDAVRALPGVRSVVCITTDKCYENREWIWPYRETDPLGGHDPYSSSKAGAELAAASFRRSYFPPERLGEHGVGVATARAGNVIGPGDWAQDRLLPDLLRAFAAGEPAVIRYPDAVRPWQSVLEPLHGYLLLAERLHGGEARFADAWNFGPPPGDSRPVVWLVEQTAKLWGPSASWRTADGVQPHEAAQLGLDASKARAMLGWRTISDLGETLAQAVAFHRAVDEGRDVEPLAMAQLGAYAERLARAEPSPGAFSAARLQA